MFYFNFIFREKNQIKRIIVLLIKHEQDHKKVTLQRFEVNASLGTF